MITRLPAEYYSFPRQQTRSSFRGPEPTPEYERIDALHDKITQEADRLRKEEVADPERTARQLGMQATLFAQTAAPAFEKVHVLGQAYGSVHARGAAQGTEEYLKHLFTNALQEAYPESETNPHHQEEIDAHLTAAAQTSPETTFTQSLEDAWDRLLAQKGVYGPDAQHSAEMLARIEAAAAYDDEPSVAFDPFAEDDEKPPTKAA